MNSGIPYFPLDVHLDDKFKLIEAEFGLKGFAIVVKLLQKIYGGQGYYCEWTKDVGMLFAMDVKADYNLVSQIVEASVKRSIFDADIFTKYGVLTSTGIQTRYFEAVSRRKDVKAKKDYLLIDVTQKHNNVNILEENVDISSENAYKNEQRKEEKSKEEYSKVEDSTGDPAVAVFRKYEQLIGLITPSVQDGIDFFVQQGVNTELIIRLIEYACEQGKRTWSYIKASIKGNADAGIKTLDAYNRAQAQRAENAKRVKEAERKKGKGINNYVDTNYKPGDYTADKFIAEMLGEV